MKNSIISNCKRLSLPLFGDRHGHITSISSLEEVPFEIQRIFYLYDIPAGESRGAHAHLTCHQILIAVSGSFDVLLDDGIGTEVVQLNRPSIGLHIVPGIWASEFNFSSGAICLVITSAIYDANDYIRDYGQFKMHKTVK